MWLSTWLCLPMSVCVYVCLFAFVLRHFLPTDVLSRLPRQAGVLGPEVGGRLSAVFPDVGVIYGTIVKISRRGARLFVVYVRHRAVHAHQTCMSHMLPNMHTNMHVPHTYQSYLPIILTKHAHHNCIPNMRTKHAHHNCTSRLRTKHCIPKMNMHITHVYHTCILNMHTKYAHHKCIPNMLIAMHNKCMLKKHWNAPVALIRVFPHHKQCLRCNHLRVTYLLGRRGRRLGRFPRGGPRTSWNSWREWRVFRRRSRFCW